MIGRRKRDGTSKTYNLRELQGEIFDDIEDVRTSLVNNATGAINKICESAKKRSVSLQVSKPGAAGDANGVEWVEHNEKDISSKRHQVRWVH